MASAPGQGTSEGLAAGFYWSILVMLVMLGTSVGTVVFLMIRKGRPAPLLPAAALPSSTER